jgi:hypothetical protein
MTAGSSRMSWQLDSTGRSRPVRDECSRVVRVGEHPVHTALDQCGRVVVL